MGPGPSDALRPYCPPTHPPASSGLTSTTSLAHPGDSPPLAVRAVMSELPTWTSEAKVTTGMGAGQGARGWGQGPESPLPPQRSCRHGRSCRTAPSPGSSCSASRPPGVSFGPGRGATPQALPPTPRFMPFGNKVSDPSAPPPSLPCPLPPLRALLLYFSDLPPHGLIET